MLHLLCIVSLLFLQIHNGISQNSKICPTLAQRLEKREKLNVLVSFSSGVTKAIERTKSLRYDSRKARTSALKAELEKNAEESQQGVLNMLSTRSSVNGLKEYTKFWIGNTLLIKEADLSTVQAIAEDSQVSRIVSEPIYSIPSVPQANQLKNTPDEFWNMPLIQLAEAWAEMNGSKGEGVIVANIDTGVNHTLGMTQNNYRGEYGWYDGVKNQTEPYDDQGHGTACMSVMAGGTKGENGPPIGVAPGAMWMACKGCDRHGNCKYEFLARCWQFIACPTLPDDSNEDCSKAPHILSYSIANGREPEADLKEFLVLHEMGIIIVAGLGNDGPNCSTALYPASSEYVIAVGATDWQDQIWYKSSRGPTYDGRIKPDLVAPGDMVQAQGTFPRNKDPFLTGPWSGTSIATPHVAGVVALLRVRDSELTVETAYKLLTENVDIPGNISYPVENEACKGDEGTFPNNLYGWGRLNAFRTVPAQTKLLEKIGRKQ